MDYRQAKRIRGRSLSDVIAANLVAGETTGSAFRKGITQKIGAKFTAVKEKFDPLNIVKFMTGGSNLAPALLGRMLGRSQRDIEYFAGTARPLYSPNRTASKIGRLPGGDGGNLDILTKIYSFMKKTQEDEMRRYELQRNYREENKIEAEKRHKELLQALGGIQPTATAIVKPDEDKGLFGILSDMVKNMIEKALEAFKWVKELKWLTSVGKWVRTLLTAMNLAEGLALLPAAVSMGVLGVLSAPWLANAAEMEKMRQNPDDPKYKNNPFAMMIRGEATGMKQAGEMNTRTARRQIPRNTVKEFVESDLPDETLKQEVGAERATLKKWLEDNPSPAAVYQAPVAPLPTQPKKETATATKTEEDTSNSAAGAATATAVQPETPKMTPQQIESKVAPAAAKATAGQKLANVTKQNIDLGIQTKKSQVVSQTINKVNQSKKQAPIIDKLDQLTVRNPEETFQRMIFYSTRVV